MNRVFLWVLNHALISSVLILAVLLVRVCIKKAPKWITCALWLVVALRLILPFQIESVFSLLPSSEPIPSNIEYQAVPQITSGIPIVNQVVNPVLEVNLTPTAGASVNPMQIVISLAAVIWLIGIVILCFYMGISYCLPRKKVSASQNLCENVYLCDEISSPFIFGVIRPKIYLPSGMPKETMECVLEHERAHLKRFDHLWKPLGFLILTVYWFHPLCWAAYVFLCKDIEFACDEKVTKDRDKEWKAIYCQALLDCNVNHKMIAVCPVAFGEGSVKGRVRSVLNYKKPAFWIIVLAIVLSSVVAVCFMTTSKSDAESKEMQEQSGDDEIGIPYDSNVASASTKSELTMQGLVQMVTTASWEQTLQEEGISFWDTYSNVVEDVEFHKKSLTGIRQASLTYDTSQYELQVYYWPEDTAEKYGHSAGDLDDVTLCNVATGDVLLLFSSDERFVPDTDIESFLVKKYELPQELLLGNECNALNGEVAFSGYHMELFLNFAGCLFENAQYEEPTHGEFAPQAWYSLGGVGVCEASEYEQFAVFENGFLTSYNYMDNHMGCELLQTFQTGEFSGCLYQYRMDIFTIPEAEILETEEPLESAYWVAFFTKGQGEPLYMKFFNCEYYSQEEAVKSTFESMNNMR